MDAIGDAALTWMPERPFYETLQLPPEEEALLAIPPRYLNAPSPSWAGPDPNILAKSLVGL
jgi:hypothetical protein